MAFEVSRTGYQQIAPTFLPGKPYKEKYHNVGQLMTPYEKKPMGRLGDYGPPQKTRYYTHYNRNYPYVLDRDLNATVYLPTEGCMYSKPGYFASYESKYPDRYVPGNYFSPNLPVIKTNDCKSNNQN